MSTGNPLPEFQMIILPLSSGWRSPKPWRWGQYDPPKRW